ncbi:hypothetical protein C7455_101962 [Roseicyclus mahoneyensis]|uniref:Uncharacterized protein n=1 Tax=Roseicyclus mahoneyensis TaxID=164332 RepID=A0A316GS70_9RHOB|nr:hypothetical protein C7455_101962 [Roseicyclus mahoneyensis]
MGGLGAFAMGHGLGRLGIVDQATDGITIAPMMAIEDCGVQTQPKVTAISSGTQTFRGATPSDAMPSGGALLWPRSVARNLMESRGCTTSRRRAKAMRRRVFSGLNVSRATLSRAEVATPVGTR